MRKLLNLSDFIKVEDKNFFEECAKPSQAKRFQLERLSAKKVKEKEEIVCQIIL